MPNGSRGRGWANAQPSDDVLKGGIDRRRHPSRSERFFRITERMKDVVAEGHAGKRRRFPVDKKLGRVYAPFVKTFEHLQFVEVEDAHLLNHRMSEQVLLCKLLRDKRGCDGINWKAACRSGLANFSIERSSDGLHFSSIGHITATAVRCQLPFNFTDNNPAAGKNYYHLKITDADGISFYSKTLAVGNNKAGLQITAVANNTVYLNSNKQQSIQLKVIATDGKIVFTEKPSDFKTLEMAAVGHSRICILTSNRDEINIEINLPMKK